MASMLRKHKNRLLATLIVLVALTSMVVAGISPVFAANLPPGSSGSSSTSRPNPQAIIIAITTNNVVQNYVCQGEYFQDKESDHLAKAGYPTDLTELRNNGNGNGYGQPDPAQAYLATHYNDNVYYIQLKKAGANQKPVNSNGQSYTGDKCGSVDLVQTQDGSSQVWTSIVGCKSAGSFVQQCNGSQLSFTLVDPPFASGVLKYHMSADASTVGPEKTQLAFVLGGTAPGAGVTHNGDIPDFDFQDASTINIISGAHKGEVYTKTVLNNKEYWWLTNAPNRSGRGGNQIYNGSNGSDSCADMPMNKDKGCSLKDTCVPFFWESDTTIVPHPDEMQSGKQASNLISGYDNRINSLAGAHWTYFDYLPNCANANGTTGVSPNMQLGAQNHYNDQRIWFYYSHKANNGDGAFKLVFPSSDGSNDGFDMSNYVGEYDKQSGKYIGGGSNGCSGEVDPSISSNWQNQTIPFQVKWVLNSSDCNSSYGYVTAYALSDENLFNSIGSGTTNPSSTSSAPQLSCPIISLNPLNWFICPIVTGLQALIGQLDDAINNELTINSTQIFNVNSQPGKGYYTAWQAFRLIALGLIVIAALVAIIAHAMGMELLDAYTIRKVLPRVIFAVIGISLSWYIMKWFVDFTNDLGNGVRALIYAPFHSLGNVQLGGGSVFSLSLVGGAAAILLGIVGMLSLAATGALAVLIGFAVLIIRRLLIIMLIMLAPLAIALAILPNTKKAWDLWNDTFVKLLLMFPIIMAFIAAGRVFAVTSDQGGSGSTVDQLVAFVAYFAPYFLITFAFRLAGGAVATIGGLANDRSRGAFDRLRKGRSARVAKNVQAINDMRRFNPRAGGLVGRLNRRVNTGLSAIADPLNAGKIYGGRALRRAGVNTWIGKGVEDELEHKTLDHTEKLAQKINRFGNDRFLSKLTQMGTAGTAFTMGNLRTAADELEAEGRAENDGNKLLAARQMRQNAAFLASQLHEDPEMGRANIGVAAALANAQQGFGGANEVSDLANSEEIKGTGMENFLVSNAQLYGQRAGRLDMSPGYGINIDPETGENFGLGIRDGDDPRMRSLKTKHQIRRLLKTGSAEIQQAKAGSIPELEPGLNRILTAQFDENSGNYLDANGEVVTTFGDDGAERSLTKTDVDRMAAMIGSTTADYSGTSTDGVRELRAIYDQAKASGRLSPIAEKAFDRGRRDMLEGRIGGRETPGSVSSGPEETGTGGAS